MCVCVWSCISDVPQYSIKIIMNCIETNRNSPHVLDVPESTKMDSTSTLVSINYMSVPSLQNTAILKIATGLLKQSDITDVVQRQNELLHVFNSGASISKRKEISELRENAYKKLSLLPLPNLLKEEMAAVIEPLLFEIYNWMYNEYPEDLDWDKIPPVYWTTEGKIDKAKTLKQLIHSDSRLDINIQHFFELACKYCLEDSILYIWDKLQKPIHTGIDLIEFMYPYYADFNIYWTSILKDEFSEINHKLQLFDDEDIYNVDNSVHINMMTLAVKLGNIEAVRHIFNKLTTEEKKENLDKFIKNAFFQLKKIPRTDISDVLYFLLSQMEPDQQKEVILENSAEILSSLLEHWSLRKFLLPTIRTIWSSLDETVYVGFLDEIGRYIKSQQSNSSEPFCNLLRKLWLESPKKFKQCFIKSSTKCYDVICVLLGKKYVETIKLILSYADADEKKKIFFL